MNNRIKTLTVLVVVLLALVANACATIPQSSADTKHTLPQTGARAAAAPVEAPAEAAILPLSYNATARTNTVARVYSQPDAHSQLASWSQVGAQVRILGFSADGNYIAISNGENSQQLAGWVAADNLIYSAALAHSQSAARVYRQPDEASTVASFLTPDRELSLLGLSPDGKWSAVANGQTLLGWVPNSYLTVDGPSIEMATLVKTHLKSSSSSAVTDILTPGVKFTALGRNHQGSWIAIASQNREKFLGWVPASEVKLDGSLMALPVISIVE